MKLFAGRKRDKALALYARTLPARLVHDYGASEFYTKGQIDKAVSKLKRPADFAVYAYAMFLPQHAYQAASPAYAEARAAFMRQMQAGAGAGTGSFYESGLGLTGGIGLDGN